MSDPTLDALDDAIRAHVGTLTGDDAYVSAWVLVAAHSMEEDGTSGVGVITPHGQPSYVDMGLLHGGQTLISVDLHAGD